MKKLLAFLILVLFGLQSSAQTASLTLVRSPCDSDGIMVINYTGLTPPCTVVWTDYFRLRIVHYVSSSSTDTLFGYSGAPLHVYVYNFDSTASTVVIDSPGYVPFSFRVASTYGAVCPAMGTLTATVYGGTAPFIYQWYYRSSTGGLAGTGNPISLPNGFYQLKVTDSTGCAVSFDPYDTMFAYADPGFSYTLNSTTANCTNGTAAVMSITGGSAPFSFLWSTGATTDSISGLITGDYNVTVTDSAGCSSENYVHIYQAVYIAAYTTTTPATCADSNGSIIAFGSGGVSPYHYVWSNGATTQSLSGLASGEYDVFVTDANGCIGDGGAFVTATTPIVATYTTTPTLCTSPTGTATLMISGGTTPYHILWYTSPEQTSDTAIHLAQGNYNFRISDDSGCVRTGEVTVPPIDVISITGYVTPDTCSHGTGTISVAASGGVGAYTYSWTSGSTASTVTHLYAMEDHVTVTDSNECRAIASYDVPYYSPINIGLASYPGCIFSHTGMIMATAWGGTSPYYYTWSNGETGPTDTALVAGSYSVYVRDSTGCEASEYAPLDYDHFDSSCFCVISGTVYQDTNGNCHRDSGEVGINHVQIHCTGIGYTYTDTGGRYSFLVPTGTHTISQNILAFYPLSSCQSNDIVVSTTAATGCYYTVNFADSVTPIHDIDICTWDYIRPRPGFGYNQVTVVSNDGTLTEPHILVGYRPDSQVYAPTFSPGTYFHGGPYWYNTADSFPTITPGSAQGFGMSYSVPASVPLGTELVFADSAVYATPMTNWLTDYSPWNNVNYFTTTTMGAYDPNFMEVNPKGIGPLGIISVNDSELRYMVHFQNTGSYYAENIVVIDTLDRNLDITSLRPVYSSAPCTISMNDSGVVKFTFNHIDLPDSATSEMNSNAMLTYNIKTRHGLAQGTQIKNSASIYFDFNAPVATNTTVNTIFDSSHFIILAGTSDSICTGASVTFTAATISSSTPHYHWKKNGTDVGTDSVQYSTSTLAAGDIIYCMLSSSAGGTITATSDSIIMHVFATPVAGTITGAASVCAGTSVALADSATGGTWSSSSPGLATISSGGSVTGLSSGTVIISYSVASSCGTRYATHTFSVEALPSAGTISGTSEGCIGRTTALTGVAGGTWSSRNISIATISSTGTFTGVTAGLDTIVYTVTDLCGSSIAAYPVTIIGNPYAASISGPSAVCAGSAIGLSDSVSGGSWYVTNGHASLSGGTITGVSAGLDTVVYSVTNYCGSAATQRSITVNAEVTPSVTISSTASDTICGGDTITFHPTPVNGGSGPVYIWKIFSTVAGSGATWRYAPSMGDIVRCEMVSDAQCPSADTVISNAITMLVHPTVTPTNRISTATGDSISYLGQIVTFNSEISYCGSPATYQWYLNRSPVPGATSISFSTTVYTNDTVYCINSCNTICATILTDTSNIVAINASYLREGINLLQTTFGNFFLSPNPNNGSFTFTGTVDAYATATVYFDVLDMAGKLLYSNTTVPENGRIHAEVNTANVAAGQYILRVITENNVEFVHFVVER